METLQKTTSFISKSVPDTTGNRAVAVEVNGQDAVRIRLTGRGGPAVNISLAAARELGELLQKVADGWPFAEGSTTD